MHATLKVPKIHCDGCVKTVTTAVGRLPGVQRVDASEVTKEVRVDFDPALVTEPAIRDALAKAGYPVG